MPTQDILINWSPQETRVAVVENSAVQELHIERTLERGQVGNVYLGKVARWNDPAIGVDWPISEPSLSGKDAIAPLLKDVPLDRLPAYEPVAGAA